MSETADSRVFWCRLETYSQGTIREYVPFAEHLAFRVNERVIHLTLAQMLDSGAALDEQWFELLCIFIAGLSLLVVATASRLVRSL